MAIKTQKALLNILLVEANEMDSQLIKLSLKKLDNVNKVFHIEDGFESLVFLKKHGKYRYSPTPDIILLDANLPRVDGYQIIEQLKTDPALSLIPTILFTNEEQDKFYLDKISVNIFLKKPLDIIKLLKTIKSLTSY